MASIDEETGLLRRRGNTSNRRGGTNLVVAALAITSFMLGVATTRNRGDARPMELDEGNTDDFMWKHVHFDEPPPNVSVANGTIIGSWVGPFGSAAWLGIPFAQPPIDRLRWQLPQPLNASTVWTSPLLATSYGAKCTQAYSSGSEDCLTLNIWNPSFGDPAVAEDGLLPVQVFIHGGDAQFGSGSDEEYSGDPRMRLYETYDGPKSLLVTLNYRLGIWGYLGGNRLQARSLDGSTGNWATLDQRMALAWVKENIKAFGGDPDQVLLFGESNGAAAVSVQTLSPGSFGLFRTAVMESGGYAKFSWVPFQQAEDTFEWLVSHFGCENPDVEAVLACVYEKAANVKTSSNTRLPTQDGLETQTWGAVVDGVALPGKPADLLAENRVADVTYVIGNNADEGVSFLGYERSTSPGTLDQDFGSNASKFSAYLEQLWGGELADRAYALYTKEFGRDLNGANVAMITDAMMSCPAQRFAEVLVSHGHDTYVYYFDERTKLDWPPKGYANREWAYHGIELFYVFDTDVDDGIAHVNLTQPAQQALAKCMNELWVQLASGVEPSCEVVDEETQETRTVKWPAFSSSEPPAVAVFDSQSILSIPATPPRGAVCESLWNGLPYTKEPVPNTGLPCVGTNTNEPCY